MARTIFKPSFTRILASWANKIDSILEGVLKGATSPDKVVVALGAGKDSILSPHIANHADPHLSKQYLLDGLRWKFVSELPYYPFQNILYFVLGGTQNPQLYAIDKFTDPDTTLLSVHAPNYSVSGAMWEDFTSSGVTSDGEITDGAIDGTVDPCQQVLECSEADVEVSMSYYETNKAAPGLLLNFQVTSPGPPTHGILVKLAGTTGSYSLRSFDYTGSTLTLVLSQLISDAVYAAAHRITARLEGTTVYCKLEDVEGNLLVEHEADFSATAPYPGTKHGVWLRTAAAEGAVDNFGVWAQRGDGTWAFT